MRKYAILREPIPMNHYGDMVRKVMIYDMRKQGVCFFLFTTIEAEGCSADYHFPNLEDAEECGMDYGVRLEDWIVIDDPLPGCSHDLIRDIPLKH